MAAFAGLKDRAANVFGGMRFEKFEMPKHGYDQVDGSGMATGAGDGTKGYGADDGGGDSPMSFEEIERPPLRHIDKYVRAECPCIKTTRFTIALMTCLGFIISFGMRCNMGMAKLQFENATVKYNWTVAMESAVDSSFFWGYLVTQVPGGFLASMFPANRIFGTAIACSSFLNLLVPGAMALDPVVLIMVRVLQGLVEGVTYPACHGIWRFWAPPLERSRLATMAFSGSYAGVVIGMPMSGILTGWISWHAPFFFYGLCGITWYCFWLWLSFEKPRQHPTISLKELKYIEKSLGDSVSLPMPKISTTPWRAMATSMPVYAIIVANFCRSWNFYLLVLYQSAYLKHSFDFKIEETGILGALPHLLMTIIVPFGGMLADYLRKSGLMTTTNVRKLFNCGGFGLEGFFFLVVAHTNSAMGAVTALTLGVAFSGFAISGYNVNHLDIAPRYASILMGMSNGIGTIAGLICPIAIDHLTRGQPKSCWSTVFMIAATVHLVGITFYGIFASGELQPWAEPTIEEQKAWDPMATGYEKETTFNDANGAGGAAMAPGAPYMDPSAQINTTKTVSYGAVSHVAGNPFAYPNVINEEPVQPEAKDSYLHGNPDERSY
ncbi:vesicular glutamate transporter 1 [Aedes aegypti]|uniref:Major facilitator superfamily (MFS) profile domain-containing protein n=2 Tax=Aedes aegypti TaxID=7159 RepID=A0A1S4F000_AEDAE|nr:vesicular glutamate transporter 1 [Aedes aegypti]